jgi:Xaa-Pro aminopeptidase
MTYQAGDVFAIEPGLYFNAEFLASLADTPRNRAMLAKIGPAFERFKGIGIKIEDNYALTESGLEWLSQGVPREIAEVEGMMQQRSQALPGGGECGT